MLIEATAESITFQLFDRTGVVRDTYTLAPPLPPPAWQIVERRVAGFADDAEERNSDGAVNLTSTDLELTVDPGDGISQTVGVRFVAVALPVESTIIRAYIEFTVDEIGSDAAALQIAGERAPAPAVFAATPGNLTGRSRTGATVAWGLVPAWSAVGARQRTPNLAAIVQEQIGQPGWAPGNALAFLITGEGRRTAEAYDGVTWAAPLLHVEYTLPAARLLERQSPDATTLSR